MLKNYASAQFKHTILWNNIIDYVKQNVEIKKHRCGIKYFNNCFSGTEFVDLLYDHLLTKQIHFEKEVTKDKAIKLSQSIMETGVFESINGGCNNKFEYTSTRFYRFKSTDMGDSSTNNKENSGVLSTPKPAKINTNGEITSLRKMLDYLREKPKMSENSRHNCSVERITREVILEKLLTLIDLPVLEYFLENNNEMNRKELNRNVEVDPSSLLILDQIFDVTKSDANEEWKLSAHSCLDYIESINKENYKVYTDANLYELVKEFYFKRTYFNIVFMPLFSNILLLIRHGYYNKALDTMNLGTLLLSKPTQAELKKLLKFLYLTSNNTAAPRLSSEKPNNIIVLNHFASCLFKAKTFMFEETRLILNFMFNNFDYLFVLPKMLQETVSKRLLYVQKFGKESFMEKQFCKRMTPTEYVEIGKDATTKALVDLANSLIDDASISLKEKKSKLKQFQQVYPDLYEKHFANLF